MRQAVQVVRPALEKFYQSLSDEQKERFNGLDQGNETAGHQQPDVTGLCSRRTARGAGLPVDRIERTLRLSDDQDAGLKVLKDASAKAADILKANSQPDQNLPPGRYRYERLLPLAFHLTGSREAQRRAAQLRTPARHRTRYFAAQPPSPTKVTTPNPIATAPASRGICPVIPHRATAPTVPAFFPKILYKAAGERISSRPSASPQLKRFKRIALRCEKTARNYGSFVALALGLILIKSVHTA